MGVEDLLSFKWPFVGESSNLLEFIYDYMKLAYKLWTLAMSLKFPRRSVWLTFCNFLKVRLDGLRLRQFSWVYFLISVRISVVC